MKTKKTFRIIASVLLGYLTCGALLKSAFISAACFGIAALFCIPNFFPSFEEKASIKLKTWHKYLIVSIAFLAAISFIPQSQTPSHSSPNSPKQEEIRGIKAAEIPKDTFGMKEIKQTKAPSKVLPDKKKKTTPNPQEVKTAKVKPTTEKPITVKPKPSKPKTESKNCTYNGHQLYVGKRGGCYYYAGRSKEYVDRSYCKGCY